MKSRSSPRANAELLRASANDAATPSTTDISVVQIATTRLFHAARCIWSASISSRYQRNDRPSGGNFNDADDVKEVRITTRLGPTRNTIATPDSTTKASLSDTASQSVRRLRIRIAQ